MSAHQWGDDCQGFLALSGGLPEGHLLAGPMGHLKDGQDPEAAIIPLHGPQFEAELRVPLAVSGGSQVQPAFKAFRQAVPHV